jgi:hypothetical protein
MMNPEKLSRAAARKAFNAARDEAQHALTSLVEAPSGWDVECRGDASAEPQGYDGRSAHEGRNPRSRRDARVSVADCERQTARV